MILQTQRLTLEPLTIAHAEKLHLGLNDAALYHFIPNDPLTLDALTARYQRIALGSTNNTGELWRNWAVRLTNGEYIGTMETSVFPSDFSYLAYFMFVAHHRHGYAREACAAVLAHERETYAIKRAVAEMDVRNIASWKLVESLGFVRTATKLNADFFKGASSDEYHYELVF